MYARHGRPCARMLGTAAVFALIALLAGASSAFAAEFTWSGGAAQGEPKWSNVLNWGGSAPGGSVARLTFPKLGGACEAETPTKTCYRSSNDLSGLSTEAITVDDGEGYFFTGNSFSLGAGGITAETARTTVFKPAAFLMPVTLTAPQTWHIDGHGPMVQGDVQFAGPVTGPGDALKVSMTNSGKVELASIVEVGPVTLEGGFATIGKALNVGDGSTVGANGTFIVYTGPFRSEATDEVAPLSLSGGALGGGVSFSNINLTVHGDLDLTGGARYQPTISRWGSEAVRHTAVHANGNVMLAGATLLAEGAEVAEGGGTEHCPALQVGEEFTVITATGKVEGTFENAPNDSEVTLFCQFGAAPKARVEYGEHGVKLKVTQAGGGGKASSTAIETSSADAVTNQPVKLKATVSATGATPTGTVTFLNRGMPIAGCEAVPLSLAAPYVATCETSFAAASSPESVSASFSPGLGAEVNPSSSAAEPLTITPDSTVTTLKATSTAPTAGSAVTYTATVAPGHAGPLSPGGTVQFSDDGTPIAGCEAQPVQAGGSATCAMTAGSAGVHTTVAAYGGDANFTGSAATTEVDVQQAPEHGKEEPGNATGNNGNNGEAKHGVEHEQARSEPPVLGRSAALSLRAGTVTIRRGNSFVPLTATGTFPNGTELDATSGRVLITEATQSGGTQTAEVYGGRFRLFQDTSGTMHLTLTLPLSGCGAVLLPRGAAASRSITSRRGGPRARHVWVSEHGGKWATNGRFVSTSVEGTTWLTLDECMRSLVKVTEGKVKVLDLVRNRTKTLAAGGEYAARAKRHH